jgi:YfiH family protein
VKQHTRNNVPFFCFESFANGGSVQHAVFTRQGGTSRKPFDTLNLSVSVRDLEENVYANRSRAYATYDRSNDSLVHALLTHGADVAVVSFLDYGQYIGPVDGLITNEKGCGLTMNYADCAPILLFDPLKGSIGLGHAGWQGAVKDLPGAMVRAMQRAFGSEPAALSAAVGPCIGPCCYEVGEPVLSAVRSSFEKSETLLQHVPNAAGSALPGGKRYFDLPEANRRRLLKAGVKQIEMSDLCTACRTDLFFSHRAEKGHTGRFGVILLL